jgi:Holliday junction resolvase RusA-like endonuclease
MNELILNIPGNPLAKKRPRFARRGKFVTTYNAQESEEGKFICLMQSQLNGHDPIPAGTPIKLNLIFYMPIPESISKKKLQAGIFHTKKPDLDNLIKFVKDCLNGVVWHDDSQVNDIQASKVYNVSPSTVIKLMW